MRCPECDGEIPLAKDAIEGEIITCPDCGGSFELYKKKDGSFDLRAIQVIGEDWGE
ncbi:MAG: lysine biosynthesis protein LysW [archaeon]|nr:lysine biosynthesis protein LysW [archaeon]MCP8314794.1 lysine biosynthesis protein LysW [archaeon]